MTYAYIRVSTHDQNEDRQLMALSAFEIPARNLFLDKQSGKDFNRPAYQRLMKKLKPGEGAVKKQPKTSRSSPLVGQLLLVVCIKAGKGRTKTSRG